ncbi:hypothetical protein J7E25_02305 [Agromyces sp. ISL-38]|uniref:hypothetical protein n=1 Tax=Agromyces sp. ISL-38 TaxID=2819107 RepID=UPI001BE82F97|nr:hypothetical protein [Agromyces sp. ISL-38]MBT2497919.1 hypothetical protein [Agromyces sp. ISL-38]
MLPLESEGGFVTNRLTPGKIILGELGGIETGIRQLIRTRPLETQRVTLPSGRSLTVPTMAETLRVKGFLIVRRNQSDLRPPHPNTVGRGRLGWLLQRPFCGSRPEASGSE